MQPNPLHTGIISVQEHIAALRERARAFYLRVMLDGNACPRCGGRLEPTGPSACRCVACGHALEPTIAFQRSPCCSEKLLQRKCHYACVKCKATVPSRFLFDERVFDAEYFAERMRESRERRKERLEKVRRLLANTRSDTLALTELPSLETIDGLVPALDAFVGTSLPVDLESFLRRDEFRLEQYRTLILRIVEQHCTRFSAIPPVATDVRKDKVRRFITLIFMDHAQEVSVVQNDNDLLVYKT